VDHPDRTLITNQNLGNIFYPSSVLSRGTGRIEHYVLADLFAWLAAHSGLSQLFYSYFCFEYRNKYKFIEYKYDHKKYLKDDIKEAIQTAHANCIRVSQRQDRKKRRSRTMKVDHQ
jgi:hypothetical protein